MKPANFSSSPALSFSGRFIAFETSAALVDGDTNELTDFERGFNDIYKGGLNDIYRYDRITGQTTGVILGALIWTLRIRTTTTAKA